MNSPTEPLSARFKGATRSEHAAAEKTTLMSSLAKGNFDARSYSLLLINLREVYAALESALAANSGHPAVQPILLEGLERTAALDADLDYYFGTRTRPSPTTASLTYASRLRELGESAPHLLAPHAYVRYMGDLSGGQIIAGVAKEVLHLTPPDGLAFYTFDKIAPDEAGMASVKARYRDALDNLPLSDEQKDEAVEEARAAFRANIAVFEELAPLLPRAANGKAA